MKFVAFVFVALTQFTAYADGVNLMFASQPARGKAGEMLSQPFVLNVVDNESQLITEGPDSTANVTLSFSGTSPTKGELQGTTTVAAVNGIVTFSSILFTQAGRKVLIATKADTGAVEGGSPEALACSKKIVIAPAH